MMQASGGKGVNDRCAVWVDQMVLPFGSKTSIPRLAGTLLRKGKEHSRKCPVVPVSAIIFVGREGTSNIDSEFVLLVV